MESSVKMFHRIVNFENLNLSSTITNNLKLACVLVGWNLNQGQGTNECEWEVTKSGIISPC